MSEEKKFLDIEGVKTLFSSLSLQDYPNNETLVAILNAIDETKADRTEIPTATSDLENDSGFLANSIFSYEEWTFVFSDGTEVVKKVPVLNE